ncbi:uncharacterized protein LOC144625712 [Crassostrea virginica]
MTRSILAEFQNFNFLKSNMYSDVLPTTEVDVMQGLVSRMHCVLLCARQSSCQTIFYKSSESKCFLYKYPMLERTPVNPETGTDVYEMQVGADAMKAVTIGLRNLSSWQWTNGEQFSIVHPHLTASLNSYDGIMDPCVFNFCGLFTTVSLTDLNIFDNCCHNVMSSFACFTKAFT